MDYCDDFGLSMDFGGFILSPCLAITAAAAMSVIVFVIFRNDVENSSWVLCFVRKTFRELAKLFEYKIAKIKL